MDSKLMARDLPQLVPGSTCARCDVCCRFPEADSFLRPYFAPQEITDAVMQGVPEVSFPDKSGSQVNLVKNPTGEGYLCPAFDSTSGLCAIYEVRPLDCQIYPLALMWNASSEEVLLGWDTKCPFMREETPRSIRAYADQVARLLVHGAVMDKIVANPNLIGRFQDDVIVLKPLPELTARLVPRQVDPRLRPLTVSDAAHFGQAIERSGMRSPDTPAVFSFPYHYIWTSLLPYWWMEADDTFFLFAHSPDGWFMPLPPLRPGPLDDALEQAFAFMHQWNGDSPVSRIEHVMNSQRARFTAERYQFLKNDGDYLYSASALAALAGDSYKSQRALCNRVEREHRVESEPYRPEHQRDCMDLHRRWASQKRGGNLDVMGRFLLEDAEAAHACVLEEYASIGLSGTVIRVDETIAAYTFSYWLTPHTWCILLEVADRSIPGLAQWVFRDTCRAALAQGAASINAMEDVGLPGLRATKLAYRPTTILNTWTITRVAR
jgi:Fe-S-cluster containining protein